jgi:hypothetical protein
MSSPLEINELESAGKVLNTTFRPPPRPMALPRLVPALPAPLLREGELFDNTYRLMRLLGEGSMGAVYEATHARLAGRYAIKLLLVKPTVGSEPIALFDREARITSLVQHPNIVQVIDHNTTADGTEYLVMEYLAGESLAQRLMRTGPLALDVVVGIVEQIAAGLSAAHARRVVHRDLKPDNVFLVPVEGREADAVKILDFGISKVKGKRWGRQAPEGTVMGTPLYMAPEQIEGRVGDADAATDQFALAVMVYEMLTGRTPFRADTAGEVFALVRHGDPPPMELGRDLELLVRRGMAKSNRERFPSVTDFSDALRAAAAGRLRETHWAATLAYAAGEIVSHDRKGRFGRRMRRVALTVTAGASMAIGFLVGGEVSPRPSVVRSVSPPPAAQGIAVAAGVEQHEVHETDPGDALDAQLGDAPENEARSRAVAEHRTSEELTVAPGHWRSRPLKEQARHRPTSRSPRTLPSPSASLSPPSLDDDATMPATEPSS